MSLLRDLRILMVDDTPDFLMVMRLFAQAQGAKVLESHSVDEALEKLKSFKPHVIISDITMPIRDGFDLIKEIRSHIDSEIKNLPAIALTGHTSDEDRQKMTAAGFNTYMIKPVDSRTLCEKVLSVLKI